MNATEMREISVKANPNRIADILFICRESAEQGWFSHVFGSKIETMTKNQLEKLGYTLEYLPLEQTKVSWEGALDRALKE